MQNAALLTGLLFLVAVNYAYRRDVLYPATVFAGVWVLAAAFYVFFPAEIDQIGWKTVAILVGGCAAFSIGCILGNRPIAKNRAAWFTGTPSHQQHQALLLLYILLMLPIVTYSMMKLAGIFSLSPELFIAARQRIVDAQTEGQSVYSNPLVSFAPTIAVSVAFILLIEDSGRWLVRLGILSTIILGVLTTGRVILMLLFCGWIFLSTLKKADRSIRATAKPLLLTAILIFVAMTAVSLLTKTETQDGGSSLALRLTATYIGGPIAGLNYVVGHSSVFEGSNYSFAQILGPLSRLGFHFHNPPAFDPFLPVPFLINVFTAYKDYYVDFGAAGCMLAFLVFGFVTGAFFNASTRGNRVAQFVTAYLFYAMMLSPFQNAYNLFGRYIYVCLFAVTYFVVMRRIPRVKLPNWQFRLLYRGSESVHENVGKPAEGQIG